MNSPLFAVVSWYDFRLIWLQPTNQLTIQPSIRLSIYLSLSLSLPLPLPLFLSLVALYLFRRWHAESDS